MVSLRYVTEEARKKNDTTALREIASVKVPFEQPMDAWLLRKWLLTFHGDNVSRALPPEQYFLDFIKPWFPVIKEYEAYNPFTEIKILHCPVFFLLGKNDYITHSEIAQKFYDQLKAPAKNIFWFDAGHMIPTEKSKKMQDIIISLITATRNSGS